MNIFPKYLRVACDPIDSQRPTDNIPNPMAATLIPLNEDAEKYRNALEEWISQAEQWQDFTVDAKGNRRYLDRSIEPHVLPLLKSLGLPVVSNDIRDYMCIANRF